MRRRRAVLLAATAAAALTLGAGVALWRETRSRQTAGTDALFVLTLDDADGQPQRLAKWRGTHLVLNFWATWCAPCVEEMPMLNRMRNAYLNRGVEIVGIGIDSADRIRAFRDRLGIDLPLLVAGAEGSQLARGLGNTAGVLPFTLLVSPAGVIERSHVGQIQEGELRAWLSASIR